MPKSLTEILKNNPFAGAYLLAAAKMDDDYKKNLLPTDFTELDRDKQMLWYLYTTQTRLF